MTKPYRLSVGPPDALEVRSWGDFQLIRPFVIERIVPGEPEGGLNGFIVQRIERTATVTVHSAPPRTLTTSDQIADFTNQQIQNAVGTYYEMFAVNNGKILDRDQFQGGGILRYVKEGGEYVGETNPNTSGTIKIVGKSVFVRSSSDSVRKAEKAMARAESGPATRLSTQLSVLGKTWSTFTATAANGLPFLEAGEEEQLFGALAASNVLTRTCTVTWGGEEGKTTLREITDPESEPVTGSTRPISKKKGGSTRGRPASKLLRTRRTGRARRRSRRRA
jgi:hypothetical protein